MFSPFVFIKKGIEDNVSSNLPIEVGYTEDMALLIDSSRIIVIISNSIHASLTLIHSMLIYRGEGV